MGSTGLVGIHTNVVTQQKAKDLYTTQKDQVFTKRTANSSLSKREITKTLQDINKKESLTSNQKAEITYHPVWSQGQQF